MRATHRIILVATIVAIVFWYCTTPHAPAYCMKRPEPPAIDDVEDMSDIAAVDDGILLSYSASCAACQTAMTRFERFSRASPHIRCLRTATPRFNNELIRKHRLKQFPTFFSIKQGSLTTKTELNAFQKR